MKLGDGATHREIVTANLVWRIPAPAPLRTLIAQRGRVEGRQPLDLAVAQLCGHAPHPRVGCRSAGCIPTLARVTNGWQMNTDTMGVYGNYYLKRAIVALVGLGANQPEDAPSIRSTSRTPAASPSRAKTSTSSGPRRNDLRLVDAFWSMTMYNSEGFQVDNPISRFAIGDRDALKFDDDGSLTLYIQNQSPGADKESNWLLSPRRVGYNHEALRAEAGGRQRTMESTAHQAGGLTGGNRRGPEPHHGVGGRREHGERHGRARVCRLPLRHGENHHDAPDPQPATTRTSPMLKKGLPISGG